MSELLAPAGNYEAFLAAISNGCNAVYLALEKFGARAYANNFKIEELKDIVNYAHLRNVKIYVTMNTIVFDSELSDAYSQIDKIYKAGVDGLIIQDLALIDYVAKKYPSLEAHASTQMGLDDVNGVMFVKDLGCVRAVLGREVKIDDINKIKKQTGMSIEIFVHGALCVSFSGNCLMSGLIGYRSGNRGRCVGSCRKKYKLYDEFNNLYTDSYILSMKDLCTIKHIDEYKNVDSLKVEGRMKEPYYVANIIKNYRDAMDHKKSTNDALYNLKRTFNRTFTEGYIFNTDKLNMTNIERPNHVGYYIGYISKYVSNKYYEITLNDTLNQNDSIRIITKDDEVNLNLTKLYDKKGNLISTSSNKCYIEIKEKLNIGDKVYKTKDTKFIDELNKSYPKEFKRLPLSIILSGNIGEVITMTASYNDIYVTLNSTYIIEESKNTLDNDKLFNQLNRLNDTPYYLDHLDNYIPSNAFIPNKVLNELRRDIINLLNNKRLEGRVDSNIEYKLNPISFNEESPKLSVFCNTEEQYNAAKDMGIDIIYYKDNVFRRNMVKYNDNIKGTILVGGYGGLNYFKGRKNVVSDFSLNVVNSKVCNILHNYGIERITLSHEINKNQIETLVNNYYKENGGYPNLEMIVYGRQDLMHTFYCPLKVLNLCGKCKDKRYYLEDEYARFPLISHKDCTTTILNSRVLNLLDEMNKIKHINVFRLQFTIESYEECINVIKLAKNKLNGDLNKCFNESTDTRGHFNKEIL